MSNANPIDLLFGGMEKLGPGSNADTLKVLDMLPIPIKGSLIVDAGCGAGRHTLTLANRLETLIHAVDSHEPFLVNLTQSAKDAKIEHLLQTHCMDMADIPSVFQEIDLLWSEAAAYNIGFEHALRTWYPSIKARGFAVVSELSWLRDEVSAEVQAFWQAGYPDMTGIEENRSVAQATGYDILSTYTLPREAWVNQYYDSLEPRARTLINHPDESVRSFAAETLEEIRVFEYSDGSYGYVFYVLQKA